MLHATKHQSIRCCCLLSITFIESHLKDTFNSELIHVEYQNAAVETIQNVFVHIRECTV
jgi:hypothetical protein